MAKSRMMKWAGKVARMERRGMYLRYWWERDSQEEVNVGGRTILNWILERYYVVVWIGLIWLRKG
jgi:hypothetical protein